MSADWEPGEFGFGLRLARLSLSFQRFKMPPSGIVEARPQSLGALPVAASADGRLWLFVGEEEAFWIGISGSGSSRYRLQLHVDLKGRAGVDLVPAGLSVPPSSRIDGWREGGGPLLALSCCRQGRTEAICAIRVKAHRYDHPDAMATEAVVELADETGFTRMTSRPAPGPLDPSAGYKGHRLP